MLMLLAVNNVGKSHDLPTYFHETPKDEVKDIVQININATLRVTQIIVPILINRFVSVSFSLVTRITRDHSQEERANHQSWFILINDSFAYAGHILGN